MQNNQELTENADAAEDFAAELEKMRDRLMVLLERLLKAYGKHYLPGQVSLQDVSDTRRLNAILDEAAKISLASKNVDHHSKD